MADKSKIEWTDSTWNIITGCSVVSPGCTNCYAMKLAGTRLKNHPSRKGLTDMTKAGPVWNGQVRFNAQWLHQPLAWTKPRRIFVCAHGDLFHEDVEREWLDQVFAIAALCPHHTFQILTKRPATMSMYTRHHDVAKRVWAAADIIACNANLSENQPSTDYLMAGQDVAQWPLPNVWLGTSAEDQQRADERVPFLLKSDAAVRFVSAEPLLGQVSFDKDIGGTLWMGGQRGCGGTHSHGGNSAGHNHGDGTEWVVGDPWRPHHHHDNRCRPGIDWVIVGGESGKGARPMHPDWVRMIRNQCKACDVAFFFKQWGAWSPHSENNDYWPDKRNMFIRITPDGLPAAMGWPMQNVGKVKSGNSLDNVKHLEMPDV